MTTPDATARNRYLLITAARIAGAAGALLGIVLIARAHTVLPKVIGTLLVLSALAMVATVPRALARRWRSDE